MTFEQTKKIRNTFQFSEKYFNENYEEFIKTYKGNHPLVDFDRAFISGYLFAKQEASKHKPEKKESKFEKKENIETDIEL